MSTWPRSLVPALLSEAVQGRARPGGGERFQHLEGRSGPSAEGGLPWRCLFGAEAGPLRACECPNAHTRVLSVAELRRGSRWGVSDPGSGRREPGQPSRPRPLPRRKSQQYDCKWYIPLPDLSFQTVDDSEAVPSISLAQDEELDAMKIKISQLKSDVQREKVTAKPRRRTRGPPTSCSPLRARGEGVPGLRLTLPGSLTAGGLCWSPPPPRKRAWRAWELRGS